MNVEFDENPCGSRRDFGEQKESKMTNWIMKTGLVETTEQANKVLLGIAIGAFLLMLIVIFSGGNNVDVNLDEAENSTIAGPDDPYYNFQP
jgi:hypothetical protein